MEKFVGMLLITSLLWVVPADSDKEIRPLQDFEAIELKGPFEVELVIGQEHAIHIETRGTATPADVITEVRRGRLCVDYKRNDYDYRESHRVLLTIICPHLQEIDAKGAYNIRSRDTLRSEKFVVATSGAGNMSLTVDVQTLEVQVRGVGNTEISGRAAKQIVRQSGIGNYRAFHLISDTADVRQSGIGNMEINVSSQLKVTSSGIGNIRYKGTPELLRAHSSLLQKVQPVN